MGPFLCQPHLPCAMSQAYLCIFFFSGGCRDFNELRTSGLEKLDPQHFRPQGFSTRVTLKSK